MSGVGYIGSKISLISKSDIRYVGILHSINSADSTVALEQGLFFCILEFSLLGNPFKFLYSFFYVLYNKRVKTQKFLYILIFSCLGQKLVCKIREWFFI